MYKKILNLFFVLVLVLTTTACHRTNTILLFNNKPITKENLLSNPNEFKVGQRVYYIFITEKKLETKFVRVRILKKEEKANNQAISLVYSHDFRLNKDQIFYYTNYVVMNESGEYSMVIYDQSNPVVPLTTADFRVK